MKLQITLLTANHAIAGKRTHAHLTETVSNHQLSTKLSITRKDNNTSETYIGLTENDFKTRYRNHSASFRHAKHRNSTELSKHIWTLKDSDIDHSISWHVISSSSPYNSSSKRCKLCLKEKFLIIFRPDLSSLNKRYKLASSCRHRKKALLQNQLLTLQHLNFKFSATVIM